MFTPALLTEVNCRFPCISEDLLDFLLILTVELIYVYEALPLGVLFCSGNPVQEYLNHGGVKHVLISDRASFHAMHILFFPLSGMCWGPRQGAGLHLLRGSGSSGASRTQRWEYPRLLWARGTRQDGGGGGGGGGGNDDFFLVCCWTRWVET